MGGFRVVRAALAAVLVLDPAVGPAAAAQSPGSGALESRGPWLVVDDPFADLWFHCLAVIGNEGYGPLPLYNHAYATRIREAQRQAGPITARPRSAIELRRRLERDSVLELVHFVPLYFVGRDPPIVLRALREALSATAAGPAAESRSIPSPVSATARAVVAALSSPSARATFLALIEAADEEWRVVVRLRLGTTAHERQQRIDGLQHAWNDDVIGPLSTALGARGTIIVSDALGPEGRTVRGVGDVPIVAVGRNERSADPLAPLFAVVRELSFPLAHATRGPLNGAGDRTASERASDILATRGGAMLLDALAPALADRYRAVFQVSAATPERSFATTYPLDSADESRLRRVVENAARAGSRRR